MTKVIDDSNWNTFLKSYSDQHEGRPTRLGVFEMSDGIAYDFWIEDGLKLVALDFERAHGKTKIDIIFENFRHSIDGAVRLIDVDSDGQEPGLDISDSEGRTAVMRFESWPPSED